MENQEEFITSAFSSESRRLHHRLYEISYCSFRKPLYHILRELMIGKCEKENVSKYLSRVNIKNVRFDNMQRRRIENDLTCDSFDVSLLLKIIEALWENHQNDMTLTADITLMNCLKEIKKNHNEILHSIDFPEVNFDAKIEEITKLLENTWQRIGSHIEINTRNEVQNMRNEIRSFREDPLGPLNDVDKIFDWVNTVGISSMRKKYKNFAIEVPDVNLLIEHSRDQTRITLEDVFTEMHIISKQGDKKENINYGNLLSHLEKEHDEQRKVCPKTSKFLLIDGIAGVGKTTFTRKMVLDWASMNDTMDGLLTYDLVFYFQFRENHSSYPKFILSQMPGLDNQIDAEYLMILMSKKKIMFICDGLDEKNAETMHIFQCILEYGRNTPITIICSTRPQEIEIVHFFVPSQFSFFRTQIWGIPMAKRSTFVEMYFKAKRPNQDPKPLLHIFENSLSHLQCHWRIPFNLICLVMLWFVEPDKINSLTTVTELLNAMHETLIIKLQSRMPGQSNITKKLTRIMNILYNTALTNHISGDLVISKPTIENLEDECSFIGLERNVTLSTILVQEVSWSNHGNSYYSFPHKCLQDFYAALGILQIIKKDKNDIHSELEMILKKYNYPADKIIAFLSAVNLETLEFKDGPESIRSILECRANVIDMEKYTIKNSQNVLCHLAGIMCNQGIVFSDEKAEDFVQLLEESGIIDNERWLDVLERTKFDKKLCSIVSRRLKFPNDIEIEESHLRAYVSLLPFIDQSFNDIAIKIEHDPQLLPVLEDLLFCIEKKGGAFTLVFNHDFRNPKPEGSILDITLQKFSGQIKAFTGQMSPSAVESLPVCLKDLHLSVANRHQYSALVQILSKLRIQFPQLKKFEFHMPASVIDTVLLQPLPEIELLNLFVSEIKDELTMKWAYEAICALQPTNGYNRVLLPHLGKSVSLCQKLLEGLADGGVNVRSVVVSPEISKKETEMLHDFTQRKFRCPFSALSEDEIFLKLD